MDIIDHLEGGTLIIVVAGVVTAENSYRLTDTLITARQPDQMITRVELHVAAASFEDFAVTGLMRRLCEQARAVGAGLQLHGASPALTGMLFAGRLGTDITVM